MRSCFVSTFRGSAGPITDHGCVVASLLGRSNLQISFSSRRALTRPLPEEAEPVFNQARC